MHIYLITNLINGKYYVGKFTKPRLAERWKRHVTESAKGSKTHLHSAIRKYGAQNFIIEPLVSGINDNDCLSQLETLWIVALGSHERTVGYNLTMGGDGVSPTVETRAKMSLAARNRGPMSPDTRRKCSEAQKARVRSADVGKRISLAKKGKGFTTAHRDALRDAKLGLSIGPHKEETKRKISEARKRYWMNKRLQKQPEVVL